MSATNKSNNIRNARRVAPWVALLAGLSVGLPTALAQSGTGGSLADFMSKHLKGDAAMPTAASPEKSNAPANNNTPRTTGDEMNADGVNVSEYLTVDIFVQDEDLANVLQMLSLQSQKNIVASRDVAASVSANLYGVTFYEALDAILHVNGYAWYEEGNFIYVVTQAEYAAKEAESRKPVAKMVQLNYLNANDAAEFVTPLLSEIGTIKTNGDSEEFTLPDDTPTGADEFALSATLVIFDYEENVEEIEALLHQLDTRPAQVLVEATILQTTLNEANAFGIDFSILADVNFTDFLTAGGPLGVANALISGGAEGVTPADNRATGVTSTVGNTSGSGGFKVGVVHDDIAIFLRALDEVTDVSILSRPKILALNRQPARVLVGRKLGYLNTTSTETSTTQTVEFLDTGTQLAFRPFIANDGMIRLELKPRVSEGVIRTANDSQGASVTIPDEITQEVTTNILVNDGSTVVLGGLFKETTTLTRRQVPVIGDIPVIGAAFRGHEDSTDRAEIIFMIKPTIMNDRVMLDQGQRGLAHVAQVRAGSRNGTLGWSRDKQTAQHNIKAEQYAREGNLEKAMWEIRRSLELNPNQPDAIQIREELLNKHDAWPSRSALDNIIGGEFNARLMSLHEVPADSVFVDATDTWSDDAFMNEGLDGQPLTDENIVEFTEVDTDQMSSAEGDGTFDMSSVDWTLFETDQFGSFDSQNEFGEPQDNSDWELVEAEGDQMSDADAPNFNFNIYETFPFTDWQQVERQNTETAQSKPQPATVASESGDWTTIDLSETDEQETEVADVPIDNN
ncbi:MAG: hypothetical protein H6812_09170 [Phycisphaeraceae bacterium]|nr:hypothetical protein [Phycisphaerales bacterium]MCB9843412.1 hypothetical protein [Phycisphaeraceae bacterium]